METPKKENPFYERVLNIFRIFENGITIILSVIIGFTIVVSLIRISSDFYYLFLADVGNPNTITFKDFQQFFGKIMTLFISLEFLNSILKVLKSHEIKTLVEDVVLIAALAIARKLIIYDYEHHDPGSTLALGGVLLAIGVFYFLIKFKKNSLTNIGKN